MEEAMWMRLGTGKEYKMQKSRISPETNLHPSSEPSTAIRHFIDIKMMLSTSILLSFLLASGLVAGHGAVTSYIIGGKTYPGYDGLNTTTNPAPTIQFPWANYYPTLSIDDIKIRCNTGSPSAPPPELLSAPVRAGDNITAVWKQWTHQQGPVMVWMYPCGGGDSCTGDAKAWFKIDQMGLFRGDEGLNSNNWGTALVNKNLEWSSVIPRNLAPGRYLVRHELLSLHQKKVSQFYAECAQLEVAGDGDAVPPAEFLYPIPGYAPQSDPGVTVDIFTDKSTTYTCPGGPVWDGFTF
ncbi:glycosyl hydrolase family 61-domain-containing protein [Echria macrotheca]|uniref:lytic cellulose monooxygenase (C4-dehydrogenating) n=1 Tax=Echria macrotheca TaxID=438768 RepID=A0AAJ0BJD3_9PEZI|nr:glycosyl hydrolase family 61-domain-containing protein [Echria macrotheca]